MVRTDTSSRSASICAVTRRSPRRCWTISKRRSARRTCYPMSVGGMQPDAITFAVADMEERPHSFRQVDPRRQQGAARLLDPAGDVGEPPIAIEIDDGAAILAGELRRFHDAARDAGPLIGKYREPRLAELLPLQLGSEDGLVEASGAAEVACRDLEPHRHVPDCSIGRHRCLRLSREKPRPRATE